MPLHVSSTCAHHQEVKIALHSLWYYHTYRCVNTRGRVMQFWPPGDEHMCSKHVEVWNKLNLKQKFCASNWLSTEINILRCTVSKTSKFAPTCFGLGQSSGSLNYNIAKVIFRLRFGKNYVVICYAVVWQRVIGMVCVMCAVLSATPPHNV
jgi:hypothetical protein